MAGVAAAFVVALVWAALAIPLGRRIGFVDQPDDSTLKAHTRPAVPLGGIGVYLGINIGMAIEGIFDPILAAATAGLLVLGLLDDRFQLPARIRLVAQVVLAFVIVIYADGGWSTHPLAVVLGVVLIVGAINAVNLFDGLDGLVGSSAAVAAIGLAALAELRGFNSAFGFVMAGAVVGFLILNWHPARVFLGDNGSYVVGAFIAYGIMLVSPGPIDSRVIVASVLLGVFALDLVVTIIRRRLAGNPLFMGDRSHIYDQLHDRGWSVPRVALTVAGIEFIYVALTLGIESVRSGPGRLVLVTVVAVVSLLLARAGGFFTPESH
jgi:UDP-GlcNAc:undecaprenyl-phosphate GlcNAc-1-phosphate transferase